MALIDDDHTERRVRAYIAAVEAGATGEELARFYHTEVTLVEMPNRLNPAGGRRDLQGILQFAEAGQKLLSRQVFSIETVTVQGDRAVVEMSWTGWLAAPLEMLKAGEILHARIAQVIEFEDDLIIRQRSYDCFDPF
jgi:ketosteroid isomerase-like protein